MSTYTSSLGLEQITPGDQAGLWGNTTNNNLALVDQAVTGVTPINFTGLSGTTYTLTSFDGAVDEARAAVLNVTGIATGQNTIVVPNKQKTYLVRNNTGQNIVFRTASPLASYTVGAGFSILVFCDGNNGVFTGIQSPSTGTLTVAGGGTGATTFTAGFVKSPGGTSTLTTAASVALNTSDVSGTLPVTNGGTGATSFTNNALVQFSSGAMTSLVGSAPNQVATWNGTTWVASAPATGVASFSGGVTGLTPATTTTGAITLGGVLEITSGGTGSTTASGARAALGIGSVGTINTNGSTTQFLRGDGAFVAPVSSVAAGTGISVSGSTGAVTISNSGVTSISAGSGISVSGSTGSITISASGSSGVTSFNGRTGAVSLFSSDVTSALGYTPGIGNVSTSTLNTFNTSGSIDMNASSSGDLRLKVIGAGFTSGISPASIQIAASGWGFVGNGSEISVVQGGGFSTAFRGTGNFQSNNSPNWATVSDENIKTNLRPIGNVLHKINALKPCHFEYKNALGKTQTGFIAQEFATVLPGHTLKTTVDEKYKEFVPEGTTELMAIDMNLTGYLVKAIQELSAKVDEQAAEIAALKAS